ncbi:MAG: metallophosphoesterase [Candidatus Methanomethylophilaceae archaeon]|jgi:putative SbcD/Mre11-related phosphoesterase
MDSIEVFPGVRITNDRCLILDNDGPTAVLGDLHLGYERALEDEGMYLPRINADSIRENLNRILSKYEPSRVVLLGDIKHDFRRSKYAVKEEIAEIIGLLTEAAEVIVIKGNHDNFLQNTLSGMGLMAVDYVDIGGYRLEHGHVDSGKRPVIIGHEHPSVRIPGMVSGGFKMQCFVVARKDGVIVLPPFSPFASGNDLSLDPGCVMADALRRSDLPNVEIYGVSEVGLMPLGTLQEVMELDI